MKRHQLPVVYDLYGNIRGIIVKKIGKSHVRLGWNGVVIFLLKWLWSFSTTLILNIEQLEYRTKIEKKNRTYRNEENQWFPDDKPYRTQSKWHGSNWQLGRVECESNLNKIHNRVKLKVYIVAESGQSQVLSWYYSIIGNYIFSLFFLFYSVCNMKCSMLQSRRAYL